MMDCGTGAPVGNTATGCSCDCTDTGYEGSDCGTPLDCVISNDPIIANEVLCVNGGTAQGVADNCSCSHQMQKAIKLSLLNGGDESRKRLGASLDSHDQTYPMLCHPR